MLLLSLFTVFLDFERIVFMSSAVYDELHALLLSKEAEYEVLKTTYEEYMESSISLEKELEDALEEAETKTSEMNKKKSIAEEKLSILQDKYEQVCKDLGVVQAELERSKERLVVLGEAKRGLESSEEELQAQEENIYLRSDMDELQLERESTEKRLREELTELQAELAIADKGHELVLEENSVIPAQEDDALVQNEQTELIEELEAEVETLTGKLSQTEDHNVQLNEELSRLTDEIMEAHEKVVRIQRDAEVAAAALQESLQHSENKMEDLSTKMIESTERVASLQLELAVVSRELEDRKQELLNLNLDWQQEKQIEEAKVPNVVVPEQAGEILEDQLSRANDEHREEMKILQSEMTELTAKYNLLSEEKQALQQAMQQEQVETSKIKAELGNILDSIPMQSQENWEAERVQLLVTIETWKRRARESSASAQAVSPLKNSRHSPFAATDHLIFSGSPFGDEANHGDVSKSLFLSSPTSPPLPRLSQAMSPHDGHSSSSPHRGIVTIDSTTSAARSLAVTLASENMDLMREELISQVEQLESLRISNARLLQKLQAARGNIQVCCRARPPSDQELAHSSRICVDVIDDNEVACYDRRSEMWRSFSFDRVWRIDASQADVFADVEPLVMSVIDGYNACLFAYGLSCC